MMVLRAEEVADVLKRAEDILKNEEQEEKAKKESATRKKAGES